MNKAGTRITLTYYMMLFKIPREDHFKNADAGVSCTLEKERTGAPSLSLYIRRKTGRIDHPDLRRRSPLYVQIILRDAVRIQLTHAPEIRSTFGNDSSID